MLIPAKFRAAQEGDSVVVIGSGIAGITAAYELQRAGLQVTVVERRSAAALETSAANAGTLNFTANTLFASPGTVKAAFTAFWRDVTGKKASPSGTKPATSTQQANGSNGNAAAADDDDDQGREEAQPIRMIEELVEEFRFMFFERKLLFDVHFWKWAVNFLALAMTHAGERRAFLDSLVDHALGALQETRHSLHVHFNYRDSGSLYVYTDADTYHERAREGLLAGRGHEAMTAAKAKTLEPSLRAHNFVGTIFHRFDALGDCQLFCQEVADRLEARGARFLYERAATDVVVGDDGRAVAVQVYDTNSGVTERVPCDHVVVCCASESATPLATTGMAWLPILPVRGYTITGRANPDPTKCPANYILFDKPFLVCATRLGDRIRFASYAEITRALEPKEERVTDLTQLVQRLFPEAFHPEHPDVRTWMGRRPTSSDALPIVSQTHVPNVFLHTGHGSDGWRFSHATARALSALMLGRESPLDPSFLSLDRFWLL